MAQRAWTVVADGVRVCHSRLYATASVLVERPGAVLVVDPCWMPDELGALATDVQALGPVDVVGFATHAHHDHVLWHPDLGNGPRWASAATVATLGTDAGRAALLESLGDGFPPELAAVAGRLTATESLEPWGELIVHDAHTTGHSALWLPDVRVLIAGDMLSDLEIPLAEETGLAEYAAGLDALRPYVEQAAVVIAGHGSPSDRPMARWEADRRYVDAAIAGRPSDDPRLADPAMAAADTTNRRHTGF